ERMLCIDERRHAAGFLSFGHDLQGERSFPRGFRPEDLHHSAAREPADAERIVDADRAGGNRLGRGDGVPLAQPHDRALAELLLDLPDGGFERFYAFLTFICHLMNPFGGPRRSRWWFVGRFSWWCHVAARDRARTRPRLILEMVQAKVKRKFMH